jgi:Rieske Fe-S protein
VKGIVNYVSENVPTLKNVAEYVLPGDLDSVDQLQQGQGAILHDGLHRLAACRDREGTLHVHSGVCTHLGCHVNCDGAVLGWPLPRLAICTGWRRAQRTDPFAAGRCQSAGCKAARLIGPRFLRRKKDIRSCDCGAARLLEALAAEVRR